MVSSIRLSPQCGRLCPKQTRPRESTANFGSRTGCPGLLGAHTTPVQLRGAAKLPWQDDALRTRTVRFWPPEAIKGSYMTARSARYSHDIGLPNHMGTAVLVSLACELTIHSLLGLLLTQMTFAAGTAALLKVARSTSGIIRECARTVTRTMFTRDLCS